MLCQLPQSQYIGLQYLYNHTNGEHWKWETATLTNRVWNFTTFEPTAPCSDNWQGLICTCDNVTMNFGITSINLNDYEMKGQLPGEISMLSTLQAITFEKNELSGTIPSEFGRLLNLVDLSLTTNKIAGPIPISIGYLTNLINLSLNSNLLTGSIPLNIVNLENLKVLYLHKNSLDGSLPNSINLMTNLEYLWVYANKLVGPIPNEIGSLTSLVNLYVNHNMLTGTIPASLSNLVKLVQIDMSANLLTGTLPVGLFSSPALSLISLCTNCLRGEMPQDMCNVEGNLASLEVMLMDGMSSNNLCPQNIKANKETTQFVNGFVQANIFYGSIPNCLWSLPNITTIRLTGNGFTGSIGEIPEDSKLQWIAVPNNRLSGTIPISMQQHAFKVSFDVRTNKFTGDLIDDFVVSPYQTTLGLSVNRLSGELPQTFLQDLSSNMTTFDVLDGNKFQCKALPPQDPYGHSYYCGSSRLNTAIGFFLIFFCVWSALLAIGIYLRQLGARKDNVVRRARSAMILFLDHCICTAHETSQWWSCVTSDRLTQREQSIPQTTLFLETLRRFGRFSVTLTLAIVTFGLIVYGSICTSNNMKYVTEKYMYAWVISSVFLQGGLTVGLVGGVLVALLLTVVRGAYIHNSRGLKYIDWKKRKLTVSVAFEQYLKSAEQEQKLFRLEKMLAKGKMSTVTLLRRRIVKYTSLSWFYGLFPAILHTINIISTGIVNYYYVNNFLNSSTLSPYVILASQCMIGTFKLVWGISYITWAANQLRYTKSTMLHRYVMLLFNYIISPCVITAIFNPLCFYYFFFEVEVRDINLTVNSCLDFNVNTNDQLYCQTPGTVTFSAAFNPPFLYNYHCASSLFVAYVPVLLYTYAMSGVIMPILRMIILLYPRLRTYILPFPFLRDSFNTILIQAEDDRIAVDSQMVIGTLVLHLTVLLTFGLAFPLLGMAVAFTIIMEIVTRKVTIGKFLYVTDLEHDKLHADLEHRHTTDSQAHKKPALSEGDINPIHNDRSSASHNEDMPGNHHDQHDERESTRDSTLVRISEKFMAMTDAVGILESSSEDSWCGLYNCLWYFVAVICMFWAMIFYDMLGDANGFIIALSFSVSFGMAMPLMLWLLSFTPLSADFKDMGEEYLKRSKSSFWVNALEMVSMPGAGTSGGGGNKVDNITSSVGERKFSESFAQAMNSIPFGNSFITRNVTDDN